MASAVLKKLNEFAPLVPYSLYSDMIKCSNLEEVQAFFATRGAEGSFPQLSLDFLGSLCIHIFDLLKFKERNTMTIGKLALPVAGTILRRNEDVEADKERSINDQREKGRIFELLINNAEVLFEERDEFLWGKRDRPDPTKSQQRIKFRGGYGYQHASHRTGKIQVSRVDRAAEVMITKAEEAAIILKAGEMDALRPPKVWYVVNSKFVTDWLTYIAVKEKMVNGVSERPKKIDNMPLLDVQPETQLFFVREHVKCANDSDPGDYRLVNPATYSKFSSLYPGSGPAIFVEAEVKDDIFHFYIDQRDSPYARGREVTEENEFDEFTTGDPVMMRNCGSDGGGFFQDVYRHSGLEDIVRASGDAFTGIFSAFNGKGGAGKNGGDYMAMTYEA